MLGQGWPPKTQPPHPLLARAVQGKSCSINPAQIGSGLHFSQAREEGDEFDTKKREFKSFYYSAAFTNC